MDALLTPLSVCKKDTAKLQKTITGIDRLMIFMFFYVPLPSLKSDPLSSVCPVLLSSPHLSVCRRFWGSSKMKPFGQIYMEGCWVYGARELSLTSGL